MPNLVTKNRDRLLAGDEVEAFIDCVLSKAREKHLLSNERLAVDGAQVDAWGSLKSYRPKDGGDDDGRENFHCQTGSRDTRELTIDSDAVLQFFSKPLASAGGSGTLAVQE